MAVSLETFGVNLKIIIPKIIKTHQKSSPIFYGLGQGIYGLGQGIYGLGQGIYGLGQEFTD